MRCPLCSGPVHESGGRFECEVGHRVDGDHLTTAADVGLAEALWMAVQALDNEADVLRAVGDEHGARYADDAERQARQLREFARDHAPRVNDIGGDDGPRDGRADLPSS